MGSNADADVVGEQVAEDLADRAQAPELVENQADDRTGLLVRVEVEPAVWRADVADRRVQEDLAAADLVEQPLAHPSAEDVQLRLGHDPSQSEQEPVVVVGRVIQPVLIRQEGAEQGAQLQQLMPVLAGAGQPTHLQAEDQSDVVQTDFRKQPLEAEPVVGRSPALALILVNDENAFGGPTEFDGPVDQSILAVGGLAILGDLLRGGLADVDNGESVEMPRLNLRTRGTARLAEMICPAGRWRAG